MSRPFISEWKFKTRKKKKKNEIINEILIIVPPKDFIDTLILYPNTKSIDLENIF